MRRLLLLLLVLAGGGGITAAQASPWPFYSFEITLCVYEDCSQVTYDHAQTGWREIPENVKATVQTTALTIWGVHCTTGSLATGFSGCNFSWPGNQHSPLPVGTCRTTAPDNFILADPAACTAQYSFRGYHYGALPGAECAVLGKTAPNLTTVIDTPYGQLTADMVANSRDTYCGKALQPPVDCDIDIANGGILDHGIQAPTSTSERTLDVTLACGATPRITIVDETLKMDNNRIQSTLSLTPNGATYLLKSVLTSTSATAGSYSGSTVIVVSPQ